jgi:hypothetical protein
MRRSLSEAGDKTGAGSRLLNSRVSTVRFRPLPSADIVEPSSLGR